MPRRAEVSGLLPASGHTDRLPGFPSTDADISSQYRRAAFSPLSATSGKYQLLARLAAAQAGISGTSVPATRRSGSCLSNCWSSDPAHRRGLPGLPVSSNACLAASTASPRPESLRMPADSRRAVGRLRQDAVPNESANGRRCAVERLRHRAGAEEVSGLAADGAPHRNPVMEPQWVGGQHVRAKARRRWLVADPRFSERVDTLRSKRVPGVGVPKPAVERNSAGTAPRFDLDRRPSWARDQGSEGVRV